MRLLLVNIMFVCMCMYYVGNILLYFGFFMLVWFCC